LIVQDASKRHHVSLGSYEMDSEVEAQLQHLSDGVTTLLPGDDPGLSPGFPVWRDELTRAQGRGKALLELPPPPVQGSAIDTTDIDTDIDTDTDHQQQQENGLHDINIAVLHVSFGTGEVLVDVLDGQDTLDKLKGGPRVLLNGRGGSWGANTAVFWMLVIFSACACGCACLLICVQNGLEDEPEPPQPRRPVRRRLTLEEVRDRFPSYHFHTDQHTQNGCCPADGTEAGYTQLSDADECTICLDEFVHGVRVRKLPCGHVFHSTCIARWLIERHAVCPLCKLDLYMEPDEEDESDSDSSDAAGAAAGAPLEEAPSSFWNGWFANPSSEGYSPLEVPSGAAETAEGLSPSGAVEEAEPRSWWPFSLETAPTAEDRDAPAPLARLGSSPLVLATALSSVVANGRSLLGSRRRRRRLHHDEASAGHLTELTEPLVGSSSSREAVEPPQQHEPPRHEQRQQPQLPVVSEGPPPPPSSNNNSSSSSNSSTAEP